MLVFDLEIKFWGNEAKLMWGPDWKGREQCVSLGSILDTDTGMMTTYSEGEIGLLATDIRHGTRICGWNILGFDLIMLEAYSPGIKKAVLKKVLDLHNYLYRKTRRHLALATIATLNCALERKIPISATLAYKQGQWNLLREYNQNDVQVANAIYEAGIANDYIAYHGKEGEVLIADVNWEVENKPKMARGPLMKHVLPEEFW